MATEHTFTEKEIAAIFEYAANEQEKVRSSRSSEAGLTLGELQKIGQDAGISPEFIVKQDVALRRWTTGEINVDVEPHAQGSRIKISTAPQRKTQPLMLKKEKHARGHGCRNETHCQWLVV